MAEITRTRRYGGQPRSADRRWIDPNYRMAGEGEGLEGIKSALKRDNRNVSREMKALREYEKAKEKDRKLFSDVNKFKSAAKSLGKVGNLDIYEHKGQLYSVKGEREGKEGYIAPISKQQVREIQKSDVVSKAVKEKIAEKGGNVQVRQGELNRLQQEANIKAEKEIINLGQIESTVSEWCTKRFLGEHEWMKENFTEPLMISIIEEIKNNDDKIVFYTLQILTTQNTGIRNRSEMLSNITSYIFGNKKAIVDKNNKSVTRADQLHMVMYLAFVTKEKLLPRLGLEKSTFDKIKDYADYKEIDSNLKALISNTATKCNRKFVREEGNLLKSRDINCSIEKWMEIYMMFPVNNLRKACDGVIDFTSN